MAAARKLFVLMVVVLAGCLVASSQDSVITAAEYRATLDHLLEATSAGQGNQDIGGLLEQLPSSWKVEAGSHQFVVPTEWLRQDLATLAKKADSNLQKEVHQRLKDLRSDLDAYEQPAADLARKQQDLARILAEPEFREVHGPSPFDRLMNRLAQALIRQLGRLFGSSTLPEIGTIFLYSLIALTIGLLGIWIYRSTRRGIELESIAAEAVPVSAKAWSAWLADARAAAQRGDWREAVHFAYWGSISFLEGRGVWPPDRARTPREYLRLLPAKSEYAPPLKSLTTGFEVVWYGNRAAGPQAFADMMEQLGKLGCPSS